MAAHPRACGPEAANAEMPHSEKESGISGCSPDGI